MSCAAVGWLLKSGLPLKPANTWPFMARSWSAGWAWEETNSSVPLAVVPATTSTRPAYCARWTSVSPATVRNARIAASAGTQVRLRGHQPTRRRGCAATPPMIRSASAALGKPVGMGSASRRLRRNLSSWSFTWPSPLFPQDPAQTGQAPSDVRLHGVDVSPQHLGHLLDGQVLVVVPDDRRSLGGGQGGQGPSQLVSHQPVGLDRAAVSRTESIDQVAEVGQPDHRPPGIADPLEASSRHDAEEPRPEAPAGLQVREPPPGPHRRLPHAILRVAGRLEDAIGHPVRHQQVRPDELFERVLTAPERQPDQLGLGLINHALFLTPPVRARGARGVQPIRDSYGYRRDTCKAGHQRLVEAEFKLRRRLRGSRHLEFPSRFPGRSGSPPMTRETGSSDPAHRPSAGRPHCEEELTCRIAGSWRWAPSPVSGSRSWSWRAWSSEAPPTPFRSTSCRQRPPRRGPPAPRCRWASGSASVWRCSPRSCCSPSWSGRRPRCARRTRAACWRGRRSAPGS